MSNKNKVEEPMATYGQPLNFEKVWLMFQETDRMIQETDRILKERSLETDRKMQETDRRMQETDRRMQKTDRQIKELSKNLGGIGNSNGYYAEQFFSATLDKKMQLLDMRLENSEHNKQKYIKRLNIREEYDVILTNTDVQVIVEIKYRFKEEHLKILFDRKIPNYKILFPENSRYRLRVAIAAFSFEAGVVEQAKQLGCYILTRTGDELDILHTDSIKEY